MKYMICIVFLLLAKVLCTLHTPFYFDNYCKKIIKREILALYSTESHLTTTSTPKDGSDFIIVINMKKYKDLIFNVTPISEDHQCLIDLKYLKREWILFSHKLYIIEKMSPIIEKINQMDYEVKKSIYLSAEDDLLYYKDIPKLSKKEIYSMKRILQQNIIPKGSTVSYYPDRFNKHLESLKSSNDPEDDELLVFTYKDCKILHTLGEHFYSYIRSKITYYMEYEFVSELKSIYVNNIDQTISLDELVAYFMIDRFMKMNFNDQENILPFMISLLNFVINKVSFKGNLFKIIDKLTPVDLKIISDTLKAFDFSHLHQHEDIQKIKDEKLLSDESNELESLKNTIYNIICATIRGEKYIISQSFEIISIILSHIQKAPKITIKNIFFSGNIKRGESKQKYYENELGIYLKEYVKSFSEYTAKRFDSEKLGNDEINEEFEDLMMECLKIIKSKNLDKSNVIDEKAFEMLKIYYRE